MWRLRPSAAAAAGAAFIPGVEQLAGAQQDNAHERDRRTPRIAARSPQLMSA
jgi:hypothetical protein